MRAKSTPLSNPEHEKAWQAMGNGMRTTMTQLLKRCQRYDVPVDLNVLMRYFVYQEGRCAGTGVLLTPAGINAPRLFRISQDDGNDEGNLVLVSKGYVAVRSAIRNYGELGHLKAVKWLQEASQGAALVVEGELRNHPPYTQDWHEEVASTPDFE